MSIICPSPKLKTLSKQVNTTLFLGHRALIEEYWSTRPWIRTCRLAAVLPFQPSVYGLCTHALQHKLIQHLRVEGEISLHFLIRQTCNRVIKISFFPSHSFTKKRKKRTSAQCENIRILSLHVPVAILHGYTWLSIVPISKENILYWQNICMGLFHYLGYTKLPLNEGWNNNCIKKKPGLITACIFPWKQQQTV